jgi:hypothetical protein
MNCLSHAIKNTFLFVMLLVVFILIFVYLQHSSKNEPGEIDELYEHINNKCAGKYFALTYY